MLRKCRPTLLMVAVWALSLTALPSAQAGSQSWGNNWSCQSSIVDSDIWVSTSYKNQAVFDFRVGPGGAIAELRDRRHSSEALLSPPFLPEVHTDRILQTTVWSNSIVASLSGARDHRFNITQAGDSESNVSPVVSVWMDPNSCTVSVYSVPQDQWLPENGQYLSGRFSQYVRYDIGPNGEIYIHRVLLVGQPTNGTPLNTYGNNFYLEAWSPFNVPVFGALSVYLSSGNGMPSVYQPDTPQRVLDLIPTYPFWDVATTRGFASAISYPGMTGRSVSLVFGTRGVCWFINGSCSTAPHGAAYVLNTLSWKTGIGILPGLTVGSALEIGSVIDQHLVLAPATSFGGNIVTWLGGLAQRVPQPLVIPPSWAVPADIWDIVNALKANEASTGVRTSHLGLLVHQP